MVLIELWLLPPTTVENLQQNISHGGYGTVYLAEFNGTLVAEKNLLLDEQRLSTWVRAVHTTYKHSK